MTFVPFDDEEKDDKSHVAALSNDQPRNAYFKAVAGGPWQRVGDIDAAYASSYQSQGRWLLAAFSGNGAPGGKAALFMTVDEPTNINALTRAGLIPSERKDWPDAKQYRWDPPQTTAQR